MIPLLTPSAAAAAISAAAAAVINQTTANLVKGQVKHLSDMRVQSIKQHDAGLEMPDLEPGEAWSVQLFRTIDSSEQLQR
jgi:hypothetical protein